MKNFDALRVLAIGAHPDDVEIFCSGTLARFRQKDSTVIMAHVCQGDKSGYAKRNNENARIREKETNQAGTIIGSTVLSLKFRDSEILQSIELRKAIVNLIRKVKPEIVLTHFPADYHSDHRVTGQMVTDAVYIASSKGFKTKSLFLPYIPVLYYFDTLTGIGFQPTEYVDITNVIETKAAMIKCHQSQFAALKKRGGLDLWEIVLDTAKHRGWQSGVKYAEAFQVCQMWPNFKTRRLLP
jgi:LmbE family N-acetylglucosaminyl deacetylase